MNTLFTLRRAPPITSRVGWEDYGRTTPRPRSPRPKSTRPLSGAPSPVATAPSPPASERRPYSAREQTVLPRDLRLRRAPPGEG
jgi:hypothetical protein